MNITTNDTLESGSTMPAGACIPSADGRYLLSMQWDGNLVLTDTHTEQPTWESGTCGNPGARLIMQLDGNLVLRTEGISNETTQSEGVMMWSSGTEGHDGAHLDVRNDGKLAIAMPPVIINQVDQA